MSTATHNATDALTTPAMARVAGVLEWQLRSAVRRRYIDPPAKIGPTWCWTRQDLDRVRAGLTAAGYLPAEESDKPE